MTAHKKSRNTRAAITQTVVLITKNKLSKAASSLNIKRPGFMDLVSCYHSEDTTDLQPQASSGQLHKLLWKVGPPKVNG